jgi:hypothetical protein
MKRTFLLLALAFCSTVSFAQIKKTTTAPKPKPKVSKVSAPKEEKKEEFDLGDEMKKVFDTKVIADIDSTLFPEKSGNSYSSEKNKAFAMIMVVPQDLERMKKDFDKDREKDGYTLISKGILDTLGKKILFEKGKIAGENGEGIMEMYAIKADDTRSIMITAFYVEANKEAYEKAVQKIVLTAKLAK